MKGVVFTEFMDLISSAFGEDMVDLILEDVNPQSGGAYTTVGTYDHEELIALVVALSKRVETPVEALVETFGGHLFTAFTKTYEYVLKDVDNSFDFLNRVEGHIHVEVRKLYPDAELPTFTCKQDGKRFEMGYQSRRPFAALALGLIKGCI